MIAITSPGDPRKRRTPEVCGLPGQSTNGLWNEYHGIIANQGESLVHNWMKEARRLAGEFLLTGRPNHRKAFERHMGGILVQMRGVL